MRQPFQGPVKQLMEKPAESTTMKVPEFHLENLLMGRILRGRALVEGDLGPNPESAPYFQPAPRPSPAELSGPSTKSQPSSALTLVLYLPEYRIQSHLLNQPSSSSPCQPISYSHRRFFRPNARIQGKSTSVSHPIFVRLVRM